MDDRDFSGMPLSAIFRNRWDCARRLGPALGRLAAVVAVAAPLAACGSFDVNDYNPFAAEKYKMKVEPDVPASQAYDQGLARLAKGDGSGAAKKFTDMSKEYPYTDWSKKALLMTAYSQFEAGEYESCEQSESSICT